MPLVEQIPNCEFDFSYENTLLNGKYLKGSKDFSSTDYFPFLKFKPKDIHYSDISNPSFRVESEVTVETTDSQDEGKYLMSTEILIVDDFGIDAYSFDWTI